MCWGVSWGTVLLLLLLLLLLLALMPLCSHCLTLQNQTAVAAANGWAAGAAADAASASEPAKQPQQLGERSLGCPDACSCIAAHCWLGWLVMCRQRICAP